MAALADTDWPDAPAAIVPAPGPFARRVRELRAARGWSQERLAAGIGGSRRTVREIEAGRSPYRVTVGRLADAFGLAGREREAFVALPGTRPLRLPARDGGRFGALLRRHRTRAGQTQTVLGDRCGIVSSYVGRIESGERAAPTRPVVEALAAALGLGETEADDLLLAAGYSPEWASDRTIRQLARLLDGDAVLATALRVQIGALHRMAGEGDEG